MVIGTNVVNVFNYIYHFLMGRMLGPSSYGELATLISLVGLLLIIPSSFGLAITRMVATKDSDKYVKQTLNKVIQVALVFSFCFSAVFFVLTPIIAEYLRISNIWSVVIAGLFFTFSMVGFVYKSILQGLLRFGQFISATIGETAIKLLLGVFLVYIGFGSFGALGAILLGAVVGLIWTRSYVGDFLKVNKEKIVKREYLKELLLFSIPVTIYTIAQTSLFSADLILVKHFFPDFEAGIYAALSSLGKIILFGAGPVVFVMFPMISQKSASNEKYFKIFLLSLGFTVFVCTFALTLFYFFPGHIIKFSVGSSYLKASSILFLFGVFMSIISLSNLLVNLQLSIKRTRVVILPSLAAIAQIILINYFHSSLYEVIFISISVSSFLLIGLIVFSLLKR